MKRAVFVLLILSIPFVLCAADHGSLARSVYATILVPEPDPAAEAVCLWAEQQGGYYLARSSDLAVIRFPAGDVGPFRTFLEDLADEVIDISIEATDTSEEIASLESGIRARQEILEKNLSYIDGADVKGTLAIEREVMRLLQEIESMQGRLNRLRVDTAMALAEVSFTFRDESLPRDIPSSFDWLNGVGFYRFIREAGP